jgi:hypothetical protein
MIEDESRPYIDNNESTIRLKEVELDFDKHQHAMQIWTDALPATKIFNEELELNFISDYLYN